MIRYQSTFSCALIACLISIPIHTKPTTKEVPTIDNAQAVFDKTRDLSEILHIINKKHYKVSDLATSMNTMFDALLGSLDPHSGFLDQKSYKSILETTSGDFFGIGIVMDSSRQTKDKFLLVIDTIPDGPSDKAGVKPLDKIIEIDGKPLEGMSTEEASSKLKGERATKVHIKILRENHPDIISLDIIRDEIKEQSSMAFFLPDQNIYYVSLNVFSDGAVVQLEKLLTKLKKNTPNGLILDLRNNTGGLMTAAIDIAGLFLDKGSLVLSTRGKGDKETDRCVTTRNPIVNSAIPVFILINNYTASAAEILAGCLKLHSEMLAAKNPKKEQKKLMVFLVGTRTFGKGSVQEVIPINNECAVKITTSLYYLPGDTSIQGVGIEPDFVVERRFPPTDQMVWFNKFYGKENALTNSIKSAKQIEKETEEQEKAKTKKSDSGPKNWSERAKEALEKDNQFIEAVSLIKLFNSAQANCPQLVHNRHAAVSFIQNIFITGPEIKLQELKI